MSAILGCVSRAARTRFGRIRPFHSAVEALGILAEYDDVDFGFNLSAVQLRRTKLSGFPLNVRHGRMQMSRLKCWRSPTMGL